jgi:heme/copper-type cytochrome/quinol oxidase subunit 1
VPRASVWLIRAALLALAGGATLGALTLAAPGLPGLARWRPLHAELLLVGWTVQLAFGVAYWILPRFRHGPERGRDALVWATFALVNLGVLLVGLGRSVPGWEPWALAGRSAEGLAAMAFAVHAWSRVRPFG